MLPLSRGNDSKGTRSPRAVGTGTRALGGQSRSATQKLDHHEIASSPTFGTSPTVCGHYSLDRDNISMLLEIT